MIRIKRYLAFLEDATANASSSAGMGAVSNAQPGSLPGMSGTEGSGDISFYFKKERRKKGDPTEVSDLRDLKEVETNKVKDIKESFYTKQEYIEEIRNQLGKRNIRPVVLSKLLHNCDNEITEKWEQGQSPKIFVDKIIKDLELDSGGFFGTKSYQQKATCRGETPSLIKYL